MPKEITHWHIADRVAISLKKQSRGDRVSRWTEAIAAHPRVFLLGAVIYDSPFYAFDASGRFAVLGDELHGVHGEDTLERFRIATTERQHDSSPQTKAFLAGALTHFAADTTFHPLVNYFSNGSPRSTQLHRAFETALDLYVTWTFGRPSETTDGMMAMLRGVDEELLVESARIFYRMEAPDIRTRLKRVLHRHAWVRDCFERSSWQLVAIALGALGAKVIAATFYPMQPSRFETGINRFFGHSIKFTHPRTGDRVESTTTALIEVAVKRASRLIASLAEDSLSERGISLDAGCDVDSFPTETHLYGPQDTSAAQDLAGIPRYCH